MFLGVDSLRGGLAEGNRIFRKWTPPPDRHPPPPATHSLDTAPQPHVRRVVTPARLQYTNLNFFVEREYGPSNMDAWAQQVLATQRILEPIVKVPEYMDEYKTLLTDSWVLFLPLALDAPALVRIVEGVWHLRAPAAVLPQPTAPWADGVVWWYLDVYRGVFFGCLFVCLLAHCVAVCLFACCLPTQPGYRVGDSSRVRARGSCASANAGT